MPGKSVENMMKIDESQQKCHWAPSTCLNGKEGHCCEFHEGPRNVTGFVSIVLATSNTPRMIGDALCQIKKGIGHTSMSLRAQGHQTYPKMMCFHNTKSKFCSFDALLRVFQDLSSIVLWQGPFRP
jgi:hypothetical protein